MALNWGIAEAVYGEVFFFFLNTLYGICHYWIKKDLSRKSCRFLVIWVHVDRSTEHVTRTLRMRVYNDRDLIKVPEYHTWSEVGVV